MKTRMFLFAAAAGLMLTACSSDGDRMAPADTQETEPATAVSTTPARPFRVYSAQANWPLSETMSERMQQVNDFALRLFRLTQEEGRSNIFSPLSLAYAMSMTGLGCDGIALEQLNKALGLPDEDTTTLHDLMASLMLGLPSVDDAVSLYLANAYYQNTARADIRINPDFQQALQSNYKADCEALDFRQQSTVDYLNDWCDRHTNGFIPKVFDQLNPDYISILMNAIYFKGDWTMPFVTDYTHDRTFTREDGTTTTVPMMTRGEAGDDLYAEDDLMQAVRLSYAKGPYGMTVLLPRRGHTTGDILDALSGQRLTELNRKMRYTAVSVLLPRFETNQTTQLIEPMSEMGLSSWFDGDNLRGLVQTAGGAPYGVHIAEAFQVARIKVNEKGTEAAAVTVFEFTEGMGPEDPKLFLADHPFVYLITERSSGAVLFVGTYHGEPAESGTETGIRPIHM
ncbi:MAG: serpin family protein [Bacteroidaceae bacterium]|nr:serpin family protein [Bacteroidaceae bacterium]